MRWPPHRPCLGRMPAWSNWPIFSGSRRASRCNGSTSAPSCARCRAGCGRITPRRSRGCCRPAGCWPGSSWWSTAGPPRLAGRRSRSRRRSRRRCCRRPSSGLPMRWSQRTNRYPCSPGASVGRSGAAAPTDSGAFSATGARPGQGTVLVLSNMADHPEKACGRLLRLVA
uniref:Uncharacterized protein n=1 Tax=Ralstonia solanacearum TaxID=305 RepID=A0A0S4VPT2_RALSL|nr:protein of unknown function [Ralstonia solanacearum]CUV36301.1 protein of unknown function [Ralstonia solanacearum]CUV40246.1 protein of unknown function [Ralstonia solanacearum]CUV60180.1 protein of unknown function [Ralstonia solanacearum]